MIHLIRIDVPHACFGVDYCTKRGVVVEAAPIGKWMLGKTGAEIRRWVASKGGTVEDLGPLKRKLKPEDVPVEFAWRGNELRWRWV